MSDLKESALPSVVELAAAIADGNVERLNAAVAAVIAADVPPIVVDELLLQSVLNVGWPRALVAAGVWRRVVGSPAVGADDLEYAAHAEWTRRGEATCRIIYGPQYDRLRSNVGALHPAFDSWVVTEGYGRTLSRPGLSLSVRELCTVAQTVVLQTPAQLHSHLPGALRAGATGAQVDRAVSAGAALLTDAERAAPRALWNRIRSSWKGVS